MEIIRLASRVAVAALCAAGTPAIAHEPMEPPAIGLEQAQHDLAGAARIYALARGVAVRLIQTGDPPLADDLGDAIAFGDRELAESTRAGSAEEMEGAAYRLYSVIAHITLAMPAGAQT